MSINIPRIKLTVPIPTKRLPETYEDFKKDLFEIFLDSFQGTVITEYSILNYESHLNQYFKTLYEMRIVEQLVQCVARNAGVHPLNREQAIEESKLTYDGLVMDDPARRCLRIQYSSDSGVVEERTIKYHVNPDPNHVEFCMYTGDEPLIDTRKVWLI